MNRTYIDVVDDLSSDNIKLVLESITLRPFLSLNNAINMQLSKATNSVLFTKNEWLEYFDVNVINDDFTLLEYPVFKHINNSSKFIEMKTDKYYDITQVEEIDIENRYIYYDKKTNKHINKIRLRTIEDFTLINLKKILKSDDYSTIFLSFFNLDSANEIHKIAKEYNLSDNEANIISYMFMYLCNDQSITLAYHLIELTDITLDSLLEVQIKYRKMMYAFMSKYNKDTNKILLPFQKNMIASLITIQDKKIELVSDSLDLNEASLILKKEVDFYNYYTKEISLLLKKQILLLVKTDEIFRHAVIYTS